MIEQENFFTSNIFLFDSYSSVCEEILVSSNISQEPEVAIKIKVDKNRPLHFAFGSKIGLVRLNLDGSIAEGNILGKLVSIPPNSIHEYMAFFDRNGFLLPIAYDKSEIISITELQALVDRLHATMVLLSTIADTSMASYEVITRMIFYHLFAPIVSIEFNNGKYKYHSDRHLYRTFLEEHKYAPRDERLNDTFNNADFTFSDSIASFSLNADFVDSVLNGNPSDCKYETPVFQNVFTAYCASRDGKAKTMLSINDFIFHFFFDVGIVDYVDLEIIHYVNDEVHQESFSDKLKIAAINTAKYIIKEELESNLRRVRPTYNTSKLEPTWKIDSLLSALYFGLFYMKPNLETYRRCANPKCREFFLVPVSSRKKKYCCTACMNRTMAARKRARDRVNAAHEQ